MIKVVSLDDSLAATLFYNLDLMANIGRDLSDNHHDKHLKDYIQRGK